MANLATEIIDTINSRSLSETLTELIKYAKSINDKELEHWVKLESNGYHDVNSEYKKEDRVPEYRKVVGRYLTHIGQPIIIENPKLHYLNHYYIRTSVAELETYSKNSFVQFQDIKTIALIQKHINFPASKYEFHTNQITGVFNAIKSEIIDKLYGKHLSDKDDLNILPLVTRKIFLSKSYDKSDKEINEIFENVLNALNISYVVAKKYEAKSIVEKVNNKLDNCDFLIGIYVKRYEDPERKKILTTQWLVRELSYMNGQKKDFIALVEEGVNDIAGFDKEREVVYFNRNDKQKIIESINKFLEALIFHGIIKPIN